MKKSRFDLIASSYEEAIKRCPNARTDEKWIIEKLDLSPEDEIFEFAAGTGYLTLKIAPPFLATLESINTGFCL
jgi:tRNA A58 N-methylase Trm61